MHPDNVTPEYYEARTYRCGNCGGLQFAGEGCDCNGEGAADDPPWPPGSEEPTEDLMPRGVVFPEGFQVVLSGDMLLRDADSTDLVLAYEGDVVTHLWGCWYLRKRRVVFQ
jgi:hypothetical protein